MDRLTAARIQTVRDHMRLECEGDWDGVIATFEHPRYELYGAGTVFDGEAAVRGYFAASRSPFPDQANEIIAIGAEGDTVLVEFWLTGTHLGPLRTPKGEIAPTGKAFRVRMMASFEFAPDTASIICERPYFDRRAVITGVGPDEGKGPFFWPGGGGSFPPPPRKKPTKFLRLGKKQKEKEPTGGKQGETARCAASGERTINSSSCPPARPS